MQEAQETNGVNKKMKWQHSTWEFTHW